MSIISFELQERSATMPQRAGKDVPRDSADSGTAGTRVIRSADEAGSVLAAWDQLAIDNSSPYSAPAWGLNWWRHCAPPSAQLRVILVYEGESLIGIAPFWCKRSRLGMMHYQLIGSDITQEVQPLALPGKLELAARSIAEALANCRPRPDIIRLDKLPADSPWPERIRKYWPGGTTKYRVISTHGAPALNVEHEGLEDWLGSRSRNFRKSTRRHRRNLTSEGARFTTAEGSHERELAAFIRLHNARWRYRGGSSVLNDNVVAMLRNAIVDFAGTDRFRLHCIESGEDIVSTQIVLAAGETASCWNGGFDEAWSRHSPSIQTMVSAVECAIAKGEKKLDLGAGLQSYKLDFCDSVVELQDHWLLAPGWRQPLALAEAWLQRSRTASRSRMFAILPTERKNQIKRWLRRLRGGE